VREILLSGNEAAPDGGKTIIISCTPCSFAFNLTLHVKDNGDKKWVIPKRGLVYIHKQGCLGES
jgi:hypothetical protein